jgi:hypothetical protein
VIACDSCGLLADDRHIRERIERLELATRFRPIHTQALVLDAAPPARAEDYFYRFAKGDASRCAESRSYFDELTGFSATARSSAAEEETGLEAFQRRGLFLAYAVECPVEDSRELAQAVQRTAPTLLKRLKISYRPKWVAVVSPFLAELIPILQGAGWDEHLILDEGKPFASPFGSGADWHAGRLTAALARVSRAV